MTQVLEVLPQNPSLLEPSVWYEARFTACSALLVPLADDEASVNTALRQFLAPHVSGIVPLLKSVTLRSVRLASRGCFSITMRFTVAQATPVARVEQALADSLGALSPTFFRLPSPSKAQGFPQTLPKALTTAAPRAVNLVKSAAMGAAGAVAIAVTRRFLR